MILWADGAFSGVLHLDFRLSADGEHIVLSAADGNMIIDSLSYPAQTANYSYGCSSADASVFKFFITPTPFAANGSGYLGVSADPVIETA